MPNPSLNPAYLRQRRRTLAYGAPSASIELLSAFACDRFDGDPWTAEAEDYCTLADALTVYSEQAGPDAGLMLRLTLGGEEYRELHGLPPLED